MATTITQEVNRITKECRARFSKGKLELLEAVNLREGEVITITIKEEKPASGTFERAAGGWKDSVDTEALLRDFKKSRQIRAPEVQL